MPVKDAPAPWSLKGHVAYLFVHGPRAAQSRFAENPHPDRSPFRGGYGGVMLVRYDDSPVGPYDELLLVPGCYQVGDQTFYRISQIYVSSLDSVVNGRRNWNVPKKLAVFHWTDGDTSVRVSLPDDDEPFLTMRVRPRLYCIPASSAIVPLSIRSLVQAPLADGDGPNAFLKIVLSCSGWFRPLVQLLEFTTDGKEMPAHEQLPVYSCGIGYEAFTLVFPEGEEIAGV